MNAQATTSKQVTSNGEFLRIALLSDPAVEFGRAIIQGVHRFVRPAKPWFVRVFSPADSQLDWADSYQPHALIAHLWDRTLIERIRRLGKPVVNTATTLPRPGIPTVGVNDYEVGRAAAEHLLAAGYRQFGFVGVPHYFDTARREAGFRDALRQAGHRYEPYFRTAQHFPRPRHPDWLAALDGLGRWLRELPKPAALFAADDTTAEDIGELCRQAHIEIPQQLGLIGANNDEIRCDGCWPPLSSVVIPAEAIGYEAARQLDQLLTGIAPPRSATLFGPLGVAARASSDLRPTHDPVVAAAVEYIHQHLHCPINVTDIIRHVGVSRRSLEQHFARTLGRSPAAEINRIRIEAARSMLSGSDQKIKDVATACGFSSAEQFSVIFRRATGATPSVYRERYSTK